MKKIGIISLIVIIIDRSLKVLVTNNFVLNVRNKIIDGFFYITNCHNEGAAFSLFSGNVLFLIFITLSDISAITGLKPNQPGPQAIGL